MFRGLQWNLRLVERSHCRRELEHDSGYDPRPRGIPSGSASAGNCLNPLCTISCLVHVRNLLDRLAGSGLASGRLYVFTIFAR